MNRIARDFARRSSFILGVVVGMNVALVSTASLAEDRSISVVPSTTIAPAPPEAPSKTSSPSSNGGGSITVIAPAPESSFGVPLSSTAAPSVVATPPTQGTTTPPAAITSSAPAGPPTACDAHKFIDPDDMVGFMVGDLNRVIKSRQSTQRYLTLTHFANLCVGNDAMNVYRQAAIKLLNSLSRASDPIRVDTIDPEGTILKFNLVDLGWSLDDWNNLLTFYPYTAAPDSELSRTLAKATSTTLPYVRADWLAATATQPQVYYSLMKLPAKFQEFARQQGVDVAADIKNFTAQRAGYGQSVFTQNNRIVERHPSKTGYFWMTYDFAGGKDKQSIFDFPTGPGGDSGFSFDSSETFFSLPNGFQGYYLSKASGERLDRSLPGVARDQAQRVVTVIRGIECMSCQDGGLERGKGEIRDLILSGRTFSRDIRDTVDGLYPPQDKMDALVAGDMQRYASAMSRAGIDPSLTLNGVEMMTALANSYNSDLDLPTVAAELGLTVADYNDSVNEAGGKIRPLLRRLGQTKISRDDFERNYRDLADALTDLALLTVAKQKAVAAQAQVQPAPAAVPVQVQRPPNQPPRPQYQPPRPTYQRGY